LERPVHVVAERELITQNCEWKKNYMGDMVVKHGLSDKGGTHAKVI
jgi:hypothetical protein